MSQAKQVTAETFQSEVVKSEVPVLVDFYATWWRGAIVGGLMGLMLTLSSSQAHQ